MAQVASPQTATAYRNFTFICTGEDIDRCASQLIELTDFLALSATAGPNHTVEYHGVIQTKKRHRVVYLARSLGFQLARSINIQTDVTNVIALAADDTPYIQGAFTKQGSKLTFNK